MLSRADLRRDPLCLEQRLGRELGRRAPLEVDGERDAEGDDQDDEDVREREDESGSDLRGRLLGLGVRAEPEAHPADRRDVRRMRGVVLDLLAEPRDVHVERLRPYPVRVPHLVHDLLASDHLACISHQQVQQVELAGCQLDEARRSSSTCADRGRVGGDQDLDRPPFSSGPLPRRMMARIRAVSSRDEKGLTT